MKEKSQDQIHFENLYVKHKGGWWTNHPSQSVGNIIHWLYVYGTLDIAERVTVGNGFVNLYDKPLCQFKFTEENPNLPYFFDFIDPEKYDFIINSQNHYLNGLKKFPKFVEEIDQKYKEIKNLVNERTKIK